VVERKLVSGSTRDGMNQEEVIRFWDLNEEDLSTKAKIDLEYSVTLEAGAFRQDPLVPQIERLGGPDLTSEESVVQRYLIFIILNDLRRSSNRTFCLAKFRLTWSSSWFWVALLVS
jgi:hypothetical protein